MDRDTEHHDGSMKYLKLLDGGLVDNFGLAGISIGMLAAQRPYEPMTERQAARLRRMMFVGGCGPRIVWQLGE